MPFATNFLIINSKVDFEHVVQLILQEDGQKRLVAASSRELDKFDVGEY